MSLSFVQFLVFNVLGETVEHGKDSKTARDQRSMGVCMVNVQHQTSVLLYSVALSLATMARTVQCCQAFLLSDPLKLVWILVFALSIFILLY